MSFYQGKTFLVTGAAGFIPSHLVDALLSKGASVVGVDNFISGRRENIAHLANTPAFTFIEADVTTPPEGYLSTISSIPSFAGVFHMASPASPVGYQEHPVETYLVNSYGTHLLLQYCKEKQSNTRFLFTSTSESYGDPLEHPQKETYWGNVNPNGVRSMYDESKRLGETICGVHTRTYSLDTRIVRIFNTYGPRLDPRDGRVVSEFIVQALAGKPIQIHGDGSQTRSLCYVSDLVSGLLACMERDGLNGETLNIGNPDEMSVEEIARLIIEITGSTSTIEFVPAREDDPKRRCPDISKAKKLIEWQPTVSARDGLAQTIAYLAAE